MSEAAPSKTIDAATFWRTLGMRATGMTVVTASSEEGPAGFLGLSASHVTADPPTLLVSIDHKTSALRAVLARRHFAVNYLDATSADVADAFSGRASVSGVDRFTKDDWTTLATGAPVYKKALGVFDCCVEEMIDRGKVTIVVGRVVAASSRSDAEPLIYFRGKVIKGLGSARN